MNCADFSVLGTVPKWALAPTTAAETQEIVRDFRGQAIVPWGGGTQQHVRYPLERYDLALSASNLTQIVDIDPAHSVVSAQAGLTVAALQRHLADFGQWLPLDTALPEQQTVGGLVATRAHSLRRFAFGSVRDTLLSVKAVNSRGELISMGSHRSGITADSDLSKLYCGSWGTLGFILEASFRVAAIPKHSATAVLPLPSERNAEEVLDYLLGSELRPSFLCLLNRPAAAVLLKEPVDGQVLVIGLDGSREDVADQSKMLGGTIVVGSAAIDLRADLRDFPLQQAPMSAEFHILSSQVGAFARMLEWTARKAGFDASVIADAAVGILHAHFFADSEHADWLAFYADFAAKALRVGGSCTITRMPRELRAACAPVWSPLLPDIDLMRRVKQELDPDRMWNPGSFVGGI